MNSSQLPKRRCAVKYGKNLLWELGLLSVYVSLFLRFPCGSYISTYLIIDLNLVIAISVRKILIGLLIHSSIKGSIQTN